jgi:hypothetical protein
MRTDSLYGIPAERIAAVACVHISTARRWRRTGKAPRWARKLLAIALEGELGQFAQSWDGWNLRGKHLVSPEGWTFSFGEIRSIPLLHSQIATLKARERVALQVDWVDRRYVETD